MRVLGVGLLVGLLLNLTGWLGNNFLLGGLTTYFAIANSGFIPWSLAIASFALVLGTKLPLSILAAWMLNPTDGVGSPGA